MEVEGEGRGREGGKVKGRVEGGRGRKGGGEV